MTQAEFEDEWKNGTAPIWVVPDDALEWGFEHRKYLHAGQTMILPAVEMEWRDNQHYRAYVRPTREEEE